MGNVKGLGYSVLMSVYYKEKAEFLRESMESIYNQTIHTDDFVLVCDGKLNENLDVVIREMQAKFGNVLHVIRLEKNQGLGNALNIGIKYCKHELVARMDSDDISFPERCERQIKVFDENPGISIVSSIVLEFHDRVDKVTGKRRLPETHEEICSFSRKRNPFNHPVVMLKKTDVERAGGYKETYHLFEDYYLWVRMLQNGSKGYNMQEALLYMRTPVDIYTRRGGRRYAIDMLRFHRWLRSTGWTKKSEYIVGSVLHTIVCMLPVRLRKIVYKMLHRVKSGEVNEDE